MMKKWMLSLFAVVGLVFSSLAPAATIDTKDPMP